MNVYSVSDAASCQLMDVVIELGVVYNIESRSVVIFRSQSERCVLLLTFCDKNDSEKYILFRESLFGVFTLNWRQTDRQGDR